MIHLKAAALATQPQFSRTRHCAQIAAKQRFERDVRNWLSLTKFGIVALL